MYNKTDSTSPIRYNMEKGSLEMALSTTRSIYNEYNKKSITNKTPKL